MGHTPAVMTQSVRTFSEREFYLGEFRGRSIGIAWPADVSVSERAEVEPLVDVIQELTANACRPAESQPYTLFGGWNFGSDGGLGFRFRASSLAGSA